MANREIDDVYRRISSPDSYKNRVFEGKRSVTDEYTGERIFYGNQSNARHLHGLDKTADVDHVTPIAKIRERYGDLSVEQQRKLANNERYNYAMTNSKLNRIEKNSLENHEYLAGKAKSGLNDLLRGDLEGAGQELSELTVQGPRMLAKEAKSRAGMAVEGNAMRVGNAIDRARAGLSESAGNMTFVDGVVQLGNGTSEMVSDFVKGSSEVMMTSAMPLMVLGVQNICEVASGQKTMEEAGREMGEAALEIGAVGGGAKLAERAISEAAEKLGSDFLGMVASNSNQFLQIVLVSRLVFQSFSKLVNNQISGAEFFEEIGEKGVALVGDVFGVAAGSGLMGMMLPATMAAGPAAFMVGAAAFIGGMVVSTVCTGIYRYTAGLRASYLAKEKAYRGRISTVNRIADQAIMEMRYQQDLLKSMISREYEEWSMNFEKGFQIILDGMGNNDFEQLSKGLGHIAEVFGRAVLFKDMDEFDDFFFDENAVLSL